MVSPATKAVLPLLPFCLHPAQCRAHRVRLTFAEKRVMFIASCPSSMMTNHIYMVVRGKQLRVSDGASEESSLVSQGSKYPLSEACRRSACVPSRLFEPPRNSNML